METVINGWKVITLLHGEVFTKEDRLIVIKNDVKVVDLFITQSDLLKISTKDGYVVQVVSNEKYINIMEDA